MLTKHFFSLINSSTRHKNNHHILTILTEVKIHSNYNITNGNATQLTLYYMPGFKMHTILIIDMYFYLSDALSDGLQLKGCP